MRKRKTRVLRFSHLPIYVQYPTGTSRAIPQTNTLNSEVQRERNRVAQKKERWKKKGMKKKRKPRERPAIMQSLVVCSNSRSLDQAGVKSSHEKYRCVPSVLLRPRRRALMVCRKKRQLPNPMQCSQFKMQFRKSSLRKCLGDQVHPSAQCDYPFRLYR